MNQPVDTIKIKRVEEEKFFKEKNPLIFKRKFLSGEQKGVQKKVILLLDKMIFSIIALLVFLVPIFFLPFTYEAYEFNKLYLIFYLSGAAFLLWLLKMLLQKEVKITRTPLDLPIILFLSAMALSSIFSFDKISSLLGFYGRFSDSLILFLSLGIFYFVIVNNLASRNSQVSRLLNLFLFSSFIAIIIGLLSVFGKFIIPLDIAEARTFNTIAGSLQGLAMFVAVIISLVVGLFLQKKKSILFYCFIVLLSGASLLFLIVVNFTPAWIALLAGMSFFVFLIIVQRITSFNSSLLRGKISGSIFPLILIIISLLFLFVPSTKNFSSNILNSASLQNDNKIILPQEVILDREISNEIVKKSFFANPVFGSGLGAFSQDFSLHRPQEFNQNRFWSLRFDKANSEISERLATTGTAGVFTWLILLLVFFGFLFSGLRRNKQSESELNSENSQSLTLLTVFGAAAFALFIGTIFYHQNIALRFSLWLFIALGICLLIGLRNSQIISFSLKKHSKETNAFRGLSLVAFIIFAISFFMLGKFYCADVFYKKGIAQQDIDDAIENYQKTVGLNPYQFTYRITLAKAYLQKATIEVKKTKTAQKEETIKEKVSLAIDEAKKAVELSPNSVVAQETLAVIYRDITGIAKGADEWALKTFKKSLVLEPTNPVLITETGKAHLILDEDEKAIDCFRQAIFYKKDYLDAEFQLALAYEKQGKENLAIKELKKVSQPETLANTEILYQLGRLYYNQNEIESAIYYFQKVLTLFPNHSNSLYSLGVAYAKQGKEKDALKMFKRVFQLNPGNEDVKSKIEELE